MVAYTIHGGVHDLRTRMHAQVIHMHEISYVHDMYASLYWHTQKNVLSNFQFFKPYYPTAILSGLRIVTLFSEL